MSIPKEGPTLGGKVMTMKTLWVGGLATALAATTIGCAMNPTTSTPESTTPMSAIDQAQMQPDRSVMSIDDLRQNLPARISEADAAKMLVTLDTSKIVMDGDYSVQQMGYSGRSYGGHRGFNIGHRGLGFRGFSRGFFHGFGHHRFNRFSHFNRFRFFNFRNNFFPYYLNAGFYYPYTFASRFNYLYPYNNSYYPYNCW
jgi:hypothetical protein